MFFILFLYVLLPILQIFFYLSNNFTFDIIEKVNFITSITSLHWMLSNVIIAAKVPFLQKLVPYDKRIKVHIIFSSGALLLISYHGLYKFLTGYSIGITTIPLTIFIILFFVISMLWIPVPGFKKIRIKFLSNYEFNKNFHIYSQPILGFLIFIHIYYSGLLQDVPILSSSIYLSLFVVSYSLFILSKTNVFRRNGKVLAVKTVQNIVQITLKLNRPFNYKSGQFTFLGYKNKKGHFEEHPFSFLSLGENNSDSVKFGIKVLGDFTESLTELKVGDDLWIRGAYGNFRPCLDESKPITLIGSGIGIVPLISIFKELYNLKSNRDISIIIAVNTREEILDFEILEKAKIEMENLTIRYLIYQEDGLLFSSDYFQENIKELDKSSYYICSSPGVRKIIVNSLTSLKVQKSDIYFEAFSF